jgi:hypothetical protein
MQLCFQFRFNLEDKKLFLIKTKIKSSKTCLCADVIVYKVLNCFHPKGFLYIKCKHLKVTHLDEKI